MSVNSMTGFSRTEGTHDGVSWYWEIRSVNGRGLDVRTRVPQGMESLDTKVRALVSKALTRGSVNVALNVQRAQGAVEITLNEVALGQVIAAANRVRELAECGPVQAEGLLALKGVMETLDVEDAPDIVAQRHTQMLETFQTALEDLVSAREREGAALAKVVDKQLDEIARLVATVAQSQARKPENLRARLKQQVERLLETSRDLDEDRLHQEAAILATRYDIEEELKRLEQHVDAARGLLHDSGAVGRKLDFLAQEFNREANTLCSKSNDAEVSQAGIALKVVIDQMREQVQNIE